MVASTVILPTVAAVVIVVVLVEVSDPGLSGVYKALNLTLADAW